MSCSLDKTRLDMKNKGIISNNDILKDKSATGVSRLKNYALNLYNFSIAKFGDIGSKPFIEPFTNKIEFNEAFFDKVDRINEEKEKDFQKDLSEFKKIGSKKDLIDEQKSEQLRQEQEQSELFKAKLDKDAPILSEEERKEIEKLLDFTQKPILSEQLTKYPEVLIKMREIMDQLSLKAEFAKLDIGDAALADLTNKLILFSREGFSEDNFTEEVLHFIVDIVEAKNSELFSELLDKVRNYKIYTTTKEQYKNDKNYRNIDGSLNLYKIKKEAIAKLLVEKLLRPVKPEKDDAFSKLWDKISNYIKKLFNQLPSNLTDDFSALAYEIMNTTFTNQDLSLVGDGVYKSKGILNEFKSNREARAFFHTEAEKLSEIEEIDADTGEKEKWYVESGDKLKKVTSLLKESTKKFYENISQSDLSVLLREARLQKGSEVHKTFEDILNRYVDPVTGERREKKLDAPKPEELLIPNKFYKIVENHIKERLNSYPEGTLFSTELPIMHGERLYAGTVDFIAWLPNGQVDILDWKTMDIYYMLDQKMHERDDVSPYNQQYWRNQMTMYKNLLSSNGISNESFRFTRMIPIGTKLERISSSSGFVALGEKEEETQIEYVLKDLKIGAVDPQKIGVNEFYLTPVSPRDEATGDKELDKFIENLWGIYDRLSITPYPKDQLWKKKAEMDKLLSTIRELQIKKKAGLLTSMFNDAFARFDSVLNRDLSFLDGIEKNQRFLSEEQDNLINSFIKDSISSIEFLNVFSNLSGIVDKLYPEEEKTNTEKVILSKIAEMSTSTTTKREEIINKLTKMMDKLGEVYNVEDLSANDNPGMLKMIRHFHQRDEKTLQMAARLLNVIRYRQQQEEDKLFNKENGSFKTAQEGFFKWCKDNNTSFKKAFSHLFKKEEVSYIDEDGKTKKKTLRSLVGKIKKEYFEELKDKSKLIEKTIKEKAVEKYQEIVTKYTVKGFKGEELSDKIKEEYEKWITPWLNENHNMDEFDKNFIEAYKKYEKSLSEITADPNPLADKVKKNKWKTKWNEDHNVYSHPNALSIKNNLLRKDGVLKEEKWHTEEYKFLNKPKNKALLDAYNLFVSIIDRAKKNGMLSDVYSASLFFPLKSDQSIMSSLKRGVLAAWYLKKTLKNLFYFNEQGELQLDPLSKTPLRERPVHFTKTSDPYVSEDLFSIYEQFAKHVVNYESIMNFEDRFNVLRFIEGKKEFHSEYKESATKRFKRKIKSIYNRNDVKNEAKIVEVAKTNETELALDRYLVHYLYAQPLEEKPAYTKLVRGMINYATQLFLPINLFAAGGAYIGSFLSQRWNTGKFTKHDAFISNLMATSLIGKTVQKIFGWEALEKADYLIEYFHTLIENEKEFEELYKTSLTKKLFGTHLELSNIGLKPFSWVDENIQKSTSIAFFMNSTIIDGRIVNIRDYVTKKYPAELQSLSEEKLIKKKIEKEIEELKSTKSLIHLTTKTGNKYSLNVSGKENLLLRNKIQRYNIDTLGVSDKWDRTESSLLWYFQLFTQFKNFMFGIYGSRFSEFRWNDQKQEMVWGRHMNYLNHIFYKGEGSLKRSSDLFIRHLINLIPYIKSDGSIEFQKAAKDIYLEKKKEFKRNNKPFDITEREFVDLYTNNLSNSMSHYNTAILMSILPVLLLSAMGADEKEWYWKTLLRLLFKADNEVTGDISPTTVAYFFTKLGIPGIGGVIELGKAITDSGKQTTGFVLSELGYEIGEEMMQKAHPMHKIMRATPYGVRQLHTMGTMFNEDYADLFDVKQPPELVK